MRCPLTILYSIVVIRFGEECKLWSSSLYNFPQSPIISPFFNPNIHLRTCSQMPSNIHSFLNVREIVPHTCKSTGKLYILIFTSLDSRRGDKTFWSEWQQTLPKCNQLLIPPRIAFWFVTVVPQYLNFATYSTDLLATFVLRLRPAFSWRDLNILPCVWVWL
jgi:hypothetical protein